MIVLLLFLMLLFTQSTGREPSDGTNSQDPTAPSLTVSVDGGTATAGTQHSLSCSVSGVDLEVSDTTVMYSWSRGSTMLTQPSTSNQYTISSVHVTDAGDDYMCEVTVTAPYLSEELTMSGRGSLRVTIPNPSSPVISYNRRTNPYAGNNVENWCTVTSTVPGISVDITLVGPHGPLTSNSSRITVSNVQVSPPVFRLIYHFSPLSTVDSGRYTCTAVIRPAIDNDFVTNAVVTRVVGLSVMTPILSVAVGAPDVSTRVLDIDSYNSITLTCTASYSVDFDLYQTPLTKTIQWFRSISSGPEEEITDFTSGVNITTSNLEAIDSSSELNMTVDTAGEHTFVCRVSLDISPATDVIEKSAGVTVSVDGQTRPNAPTGLTADNIGQNEATIRWTVESISYNPETYVVQYGTSEDNLNMTSATVESGDDINAMDFQLEATITGLQNDTHYYYQVVATNGAGSTASSIRTFTIGEDVTLFQIRLSGFVSCLEWVDSNSAATIEEIVNVIVDSVNQRCSCSINASQITNGVLRCFPESPQAVTFRATLNGRPGAYSSDMVKHISEWAATSDLTIPVQNVLRSVDGSCVVAITSYDDGECESRMTEEIASESDTVSIPVAAIIGGIVAVVLILVLTTSVILVILLVVSSKKTMKKPTSRNAKDPLPAVGLMSDITSTRIYETVGPKYEDLAKYSEDYVEMKPIEKQQMTGDYEFTHCAAYETPSKTTPAVTSGGQSNSGPEKKEEEKKEKVDQEEGKSERCDDDGSYVQV